MSRRSVALLSSVVTIIVIAVIAVGVWAYQRTRTNTAVSPSTAQTSPLANTAARGQAPTDLSAPNAPTTTATSAGSSDGLAHSTPTDVTKIPLGDGKVSTSPKVGYIYSCQTSFNGGGAEHAGDWINGSTWDLTKKIAVQGSVSWPNAAFSAAVQGAQRLLSGNGLPVDATTGIFPIAASDPAYQYDRNPNSIKEQTVSYNVSANPTAASTPTCVPMGVIGYALNGVAIFNGLDAAGRDAVAHETQDSCDGHPEQDGSYHYHGPSTCMPHVEENAQLVGYALDGFGIYSLKDKNGNEYTNTDLDACHGTTGEVEWNGQTVNMYHYVLTREYPYTIGCFHGTPVNTHAGPGAGAQPTTTTTGPPQAAITACSSKTAGAACSFSTAQGSTVSGTCRTPPNSSSLACVPS